MDVVSVSLIRFLSNMRSELWDTCLCVCVAPQNKDGGFLVRDSSKPGKYTVSLFTKSGGSVRSQTLHYLLLICLATFVKCNQQDSFVCEHISKEHFVMKAETEGHTGREM